MNLSFYKLAVGRNDILLINMLGEIKPDEALLPALARAICRRRKGVGASGVLFLLDHDEAGAAARCFTPRGREIRRFSDPLFAAARYLFDSGFSGTRALTLATETGIRTIEAIDSANFRISLGRPENSDGGEFTEMITADGGSYLAVEGRTLPVTPVVLERLWGVFFFDADPRRDNRPLGRKLAQARLFSRRFTPVFVRVLSDDDIMIHPWWRKGRRGYPREISQAAAAATAACAARGFTGRSVMSRCDGYDLYLEWSEGNGELLCTGGAEYIFTGDFFFDEERRSGA